jgi:iron complex outermembrane recepter protein
MRLVLDRRTLPSLALLATLLAPARASGQTHSDTDLLSMSLQDLSQVKVFTASRHVEDAREAPSSVTVISAEEIRRYGWRTFSDALNSVRGFYTSYDRSYSSVGMRGFMRPGDFNTHVLLLINGHRINDNVYGSAYIGTEFPLDLDLIDRIEVVRGPGSSLFGTNAIYGVINVITRTAGTQNTGEVSGDVASFLTRSGRLTGSATHGRLSALVSGSLYDSAGHSSLFFPAFATPQTNYGFADNIDGGRYAHIFADLRYGNLRVQSLYSSRMKIAPTAPSATVFDDPGTRYNDTQMYFDVDYRRSLTANTDWDLRATYDHFNYHGTFAYSYSGTRILNFDTGYADWSGLETTLDHQMGRHHLTVGASYQYAFRADLKNFDPGMPPFIDDHRTPWQAATFAEATFKLRRDLTFHGGGRFDYFSAYGAAFSPRAALIYSPTSSTTLKYIYGTAFSAPSDFDSYYTDDYTIERPLQPLKKENISSHEAVLEQRLTAWIGMTVDGYYDDLDHLIDWSIDRSNGMAYAGNVGQDRGDGVEFELDANRTSGWMSGLEGRASYALAKAYNKVEHERLDNSPLHLAKFNASIPVTRRAFAGIEAFYTSAQTTYQATRVSPWFLTNLTLSTQPLWGGWQFSASCYNAFDRRYFDPAGLNLVEPAIQQDGRSYRFKISYRIRGESQRSTR